jgi:hypothetical protein
MARQLPVDLCVLPQVLSMLEMDDLARLGAACKAWRAPTARFFKTCLRTHGVSPRRKRLAYWASCAGVGKIFGKRSARDEYLRCLAGRRGKDALESTGVEGEILRDITRTFPDNEFFRAQGQDMLANVLRAVSVFSPAVSYCQGMNYVAASLLLEASTSLHDSRRSLTLKKRFSSHEDEEISSEIRAFSLLCGFIENLDMRELWRPGVPQLKLRIFQFDRLLNRLNPSLWAHFRQIGVTPDFFASQWFLTLLSYNLRFQDLERVWDVLLTDGWKTVFRVGIAVLSRLNLKDKGLEELGRYFKDPSGRIFRADHPGELIRIACAVKGITTRVLVELEGDYVAHILSQQLSENPDVHGAVAFVDRRVAAIVRQELTRLDAPIRGDVGILRDKIEQTDRALREARLVFQTEAREFVECQADVEELQEAKRAISSQARALVLSADAQESDFTALQAKIGAVEAQLIKERERFIGVLWRTTQAQIDLEEQLERKRVFSEQLRAVVDRNEQSRANRMKTLFKELNSGSPLSSGEGAGPT